MNLGWQMANCAIIQPVKMNAPDTAILSSKGGFTTFSFAGNTVKFLTPKLVRYTRVMKWDDGYLEVGADYGKGEVEEYIDLDPILEDLYLNPREFLSAISNVEVRYV